MQKGHVLDFSCRGCEETIPFSLLDIEEKKVVECSDCKARYSFQDPDLRRQLKKFVSLCRQIHDSEEILGSTSVGIDVGDKKVQVPFRLLLTRFTNTLDLQIGDRTLSISFRMEPVTSIREMQKGEK